MKEILGGPKRAELNQRDERQNENLSTLTFKKEFPSDKMISTLPLYLLNMVRVPSDHLGLL